MKPDQEHVIPLEKYNDQDFADWLRSGFGDAHNNRNQISAFAPLNYFVLRTGDLTNELNNIYKLLSEPTKKKFRSGIGIALVNLPPILESVPIVRSLLHLSGRIHATEVLPAIVQQIGNGFFGIPEMASGRELFALALDIVAGMAPARGVQNTLRRLITSGFFQAAYAPRAFIALCRVAPQKFPEHLDELRGWFSEFHSKRGEENVHFTALRFVQYVDLHTIAQNLGRVNFSGAPGTSWDTDNWLGNALFIVDKAPLELFLDADSYKIARRNQATIGNAGYKILLGNDLSKWDRDYDVEKYLSKCLCELRKEENEKIEDEIIANFMNNAPDVFSLDEFKLCDSLQVLCSALKKDFISSNCESIDDINGLLKRDDLYEMIVAHKGDVANKFPANSWQLLLGTKRTNLSRFNRSVIEEVYQVAPKSHEKKILDYDRDVFTCLMKPESPLYPPHRGRALSRLTNEGIAL